MTQYVKAEEIGLHDDNVVSLVLGSRNNGKTGKRAIYMIRKHHGEIIPFYKNEFSAGAEFIKNVTNISGLHVRKQYVTEHREYVKMGLEILDNSILEFEDKTISKPIITDCALLFSLPSDGREILIEDRLYDPKHLELIQEDLNKFKKEVKIKKIKSFTDILKSAEGQMISERGKEALKFAYESFNNIQNNAKFKIIDDLRYDIHKKEQPKIDESKYSEWEICDIEQHSMRKFDPRIPFIVMQQEELIGVFKEKGKNVKYEIPLGRNEATLRNIAKWVDNKKLKDDMRNIETEKATHQIPQNCSGFLSNFLQKNKVRIEHSYFSGNFAMDVVPNNETGNSEQRILLEPQASFVTLSNDKEKRTVETPTMWALILGLENSNVLKVKKETKNLDTKPVYIA